VVTDGKEVIYRAFIMKHRAQEIDSLPASVMRVVSVSQFCQFEGGHKFGHRYQARSRHQQHFGASGLQTSIRSSRVY